MCRVRVVHTFNYVESVRFNTFMRYSSVLLVIGILLCKYNI